MLRRILYIDLTRKESWVKDRSDLFEKYIGGAGVAIQLLHEECPEGCDALGPESPIILAVGPSTSLFPLASKTVAMFKSPHTGNLGESHCGGRSAVAIRMAGYGAIVVKGQSETPLYLAIHGDEVRFRDASSLWGMESAFTVARVIREREPGSGLRTILRIGKGGENLVSYACVTTETYRHFGRLGLGAVFGSKKLKAITVSGRRSIPVNDKKHYREVYDGIFHTAVESEAMKKYHELGTPQNILPLNRLGGLPTRNLQNATFEGAEEISGEAMAEKYLGRRIACAHCPVACIHIAALKEPYEDDPYFHKTTLVSYDFELLYALGSMLGASDASAVLKLLDAVEKVALDAMSTGVVLAWATEALERGLISEKETLASLRWGDCDAYRTAVAHIAEQPNDFYKALARGVDHAASVYGGEEFALAFGGNEMPGYHTGPAAHTGFLVGARHSHLDNAGYSVDQKTIGGDPVAPEQLAESLVTEETWRQVLSSLAVCFFARGVYTPEIVSEVLSVSGMNFTHEEMVRVGEEILAEKYRFKLREGFSFPGLRIPQRILETPSPMGQLDESYIRKAVACVQERITRRLEKVDTRIGSSP
ncbi:MAG: aldehyde ferredoxin oxidoreductase family protein [Candidatus Eisenbacteria sp.]|nr:aldehyde ferredoxin oxidoreductase family protein [Candidatus Eisenbacteria bacterium]